MRIAVLKEKTDKRIAITADVAKKLLELSHEIVDDVSGADVVVSVNPPTLDSIEQMKDGAISIAVQKPHLNRDNIELFKKKGIAAFALDMIPRTTKAQYMDVLSSQSSLAGYRAVIEAAHSLDRSFSMMMTTAGTIPAARVLVVGVGVAGLQAIATAKRLGAVVSAFDVRPSAKEQAESLGAKFIEVDAQSGSDGVYATQVSEEYKRAQKRKLTDVISSQDVVITTAQIPFKKAPIIIEAEMVDLMKDNSVIIDLASESGGNCDLTEHGKIVTHKGVKIISFNNILDGIHHDASRMFAKNIYAFLELLFEVLPNISSTDDEIIRGTLLTYNNQLMKEIP